MADESGDLEDEITLQEALEAQEFHEKQSEAVLGASDPENCSYSKGYMKRQALYACLTCNPKGAPFAQAAGICLACTYKCHEDHELVELFTKRHFRCDCGNKKFPDNPCRLQPEKEDTNPENTYNQNYNGLYCSCHRPYPDPDVDNEVADDPMVQCIACEDWFHFKHSLAYLNVDFEAMEDDFELICGPCVKRLEFLEHYGHLSLKPVASAAPVVDQSTCKESPEENVVNAQSEAPTNPIKEVPVTTKDHSEDTTSQDSGVASLSGSDNSSSDAATCQLQKYSKQALSFTDLQAVAWKGSLRSSLCRCTSCLELYQKLNVQFLLDVEDTIEHYEEVGKKKTEDAKLTAEASINSQVDRLGRVGQIEFVHGYNYLKDQLADFLKGHADNDKTVKKEDVVNFFEKMNEEVQANKRRRLE